MAKHKTSTRRPTKAQIIPVTAPLLFSMGLFPSFSIQPEVALFTIEKTLTEGRSGFDRDIVSDC